MKKTTSTDEITMRSLHAHLCLVIVMILQKSYALPTSAVKTDSSLFLSKHENVQAGKCYLNQKEKMANCAFRMLTDVPQDLFSDIQTLLLFGNQITVLQNTTFQAYLQLVWLDLQTNRIHSIEKGTFSPLVDLVYLKLFYNPLFNVNGDQFQWMCKLQYLILPYTDLSSFSVAIKKRAPKLQTDDMELNGHSPDKISTPSEEEVNEIDLSANHITSLTTENLEIYSECIPISLKLYANPFEMIDPDAITSLHVTALHFGRRNMSFDMIRNITFGVSKSDVIKNLSLESMRMTNVPHDLFDFLRNKSLTKLSLYENDLLLYPSVFAALTHVSTLDISDCNLKTINPRYFDGMVGLRELLAYKNDINYFNPSGTTWKINLYRMELGLENCKAIEQHAFRGLQNLKTLFLDQNIAKKHDDCRMVINSTKLQEFTFFPGSDYTSLTLNTPNLKEFSFTNVDLRASPLFTLGLFTVAKSLEKSNYSCWYGHDDIMYKGQTVFSDMYKLNILNLSKNSFDNLPSAVFKDLFSLKSLCISENHIQTIEPNAFIGLNALETLDLKRNEIFSLSGDILRHMKRLINLHLGFNTLSYFEMDLFISTPNLTTLTLPYNRFVGFNSSTFEPLRSSLKWLDIAGNNLVCNCEIDWLVKYFGESLLHGDRGNKMFKNICYFGAFARKAYRNLSVQEILWS